jgi:hypothetical protein
MPRCFYLDHRPFSTNTYTCPSFIAACDIATDKADTIDDNSNTVISSNIEWWKLIFCLPIK